jgi:hypothetical protein
MKKCSQLHAGQPEPQVGIFWLVDKRLIIFTTPLSEVGKCCDFKNYEGDHVTLWEEMEKRGEVPRGSEYEEPPRGRVNYNTKTQRFTLYADTCILRKKDVVKKLLRLLHLPGDTTLSTDPHYKCYHCRTREPQCDFLD